MKPMTLTEQLKRFGRSTARLRILKTFGRRPHGQELLANTIAQVAQVPIESLRAELWNLKRFGLLANEPVPERWWPSTHPRAKLWHMTDEGRRIYTIIGR